MQGNSSPSATRYEIENKQNKLTFDSMPTSGSLNPVTSSGIYIALSNKQDSLTFDSTPTSGSSNPVTSDGIYQAIQNSSSSITVDSALSSTSINPVQNKVINTALSNKQDKLTFDTTPTSGSSNPITSGGAYTALSGKAPTSHASSGTTYGVGTASNYGHCKTINNLTTSSYTNGEALSAYQGYQLKTDIDNKPGQSVTSYTGAEIFNAYSGSTKNTASATCAHAEGAYNTASGEDSHAEGLHTVASGMGTHAEGGYTKAQEYTAHAEGSNTTASGYYTHAEGTQTTASGEAAHAEGNMSQATGAKSHAEGWSTVASGEAAHSEGLNTKASSDYSHAEGKNTTASNYASHAQGKYNKAMTTGGSESNTVGDAMVIGKGTGSSSLSNCFRVTYAGAVYGLSSFNTSGADYAEYFEWLDGNLSNEDRVGYFVTLLGEKIVKARSGDYILGIVSGQPCIIGNADEDWLGRWEHDEFGRFVREDVFKLKDDENGQPIEGEYELDENGNRVLDGWKYKENPDYDASQQYIERKDRKEWSAVGMLGVLAVRDDGTCIVNGYAQVTDQSTATKAEVQGPNTYQVIKRVSDNVIKIVFR